MHIKRTRHPRREAARWQSGAAVQLGAAVPAMRDATVPAAPDRAAKPRRAVLLSWKPLRKNTLRGFCAIELPVGLVIRDVGVHAQGDRRWASLPGKPQIGRDGQPIRDSTGKALLLRRLRVMLGRKTLGSDTRVVSRSGAIAMAWFNLNCVRAERSVPRRRADGAR
jgi:hypothetical protein